MINDYYYEQSRERRKKLVETTFCEVKLNDPSNFIKIREVLTRIGVPSTSSKTLYQSCHILHIKGRYYIVHFKQMFELDGKNSTYTKNDEIRVSKIATMLEDWDLVTIVDSKKWRLVDYIFLDRFVVLRYDEKKDWKLISKYDVGKRGPVENLKRIRSNNE